MRLLKAFIVGDCNLLHTNKTAPTAANIKMNERTFLCSKYLAGDDFDFCHQNRDGQSPEGGQRGEAGLVS